MTPGQLEPTEDTTANFDGLVNNVIKFESLVVRLATALSHSSPANPAISMPGPELWQKAAQAYWEKAAQQPFEVIKQQIAFWSATTANIAHAQGYLLEDDDAQPEKDRRFSNPMWETNPALQFIKHQYRLNAHVLDEAVAGAEGLDHKEKQRLAYFVEQIVNMMSPSNYIASNPDVIEKAIETEGQSLLQGLENLVKDLEANDGDLVVRLADEDAFQLGENIATTPGEVVYRNRMMELIQYAPTTETVRETPIVLFPPWINKFYILDLKEKNSLIKWITDQGYTLFVVSWVNPDASYADTGLEDYIEDGYLTAIREAKAICGVEQVNAVGYCIAGTTLNLTLALLKKRGDTSVKSATFFTTLTDFSDQGEFTPFLQDDFIDGIEDEVSETGMLRSRIMARTFSFLRSRDLVYGPAVRNYMMGEAPPAFDLLYWNGDGTNLPAKMVVQYLRGLCQRNELSEGTFEIFGETLSLADVDVPLMAITCESDHIAAWKDCYRGFLKQGSKDKTFIVSESGHIAGIVNPPSKKKYGHYTNKKAAKTPDAWLDKATFNEGSWWPRWEAWLGERSGEQVAARTPAEGERASLGKAPGQYVRG